MVYIRNQMKADLQDKDNKEEEISKVEQQLHLKNGD